MTYTLSEGYLLWFSCDSPLQKGVNILIKPWCLNALHPISLKTHERTCIYIFIIQQLRHPPRSKKLKICNSRTPCSWTRRWKQILHPSPVSNRIHQISQTASWAICCKGSALLKGLWSKNSSYALNSKLFNFYSLCVLTFAHSSKQRSK